MSWSHPAVRLLRCALAGAGSSRICGHCGSNSQTEDNTQLPSDVLHRAGSLHPVGVPRQSHAPPRLRDPVVAIGPPKYLLSKVQ